MRRACTLLAGLAMALAACGARAPAPEDAQVLHPFPRFADADPHDGVGALPSRFAVHGIDAAHWQGAIDWPVARAAGVSFAYLKATEGGDVADPAFAGYWRAARAAGLRVGAYHFFYFCRPAEVQAAWFIRTVPKTPGMLPPVLDLEWNPRSPTCRLRPDGAAVRAEAERFLDRVEQHYGQRPLVYTTPEFYAQNDLGRLPRVQFWLRSVAAPPDEVYPGQPWIFWQYTGTGRVPGIARPVDLNAFAGSLGDWAAWAR